MARAQSTSAAAAAQGSPAEQPSSSSSSSTRPADAAKARQRDEASSSFVKESMIGRLFGFMMLKSSSSSSSTTTSAKMDERKKRKERKQQQVAAADKAKEEEEEETMENNGQGGEEEDEELRSFYMVLLRIVLWNDSFESMIHVLAFNVAYWAYCFLPINGMLAVCSAAGIMAITSVSTTERLDKEARKAFRAKLNSAEKLFDKYKRELAELPSRWDDYSFEITLLLLVFSFTTIFVLPKFEPVVLVYGVLMTIFLAPPVLLACSGVQPSNTEQDGEISEFLPEATEDEMHVLNRAGESGDSPTPSNSNSANGNSCTADNLDEEDLEGMRMPSHEEDEESADELSDIEFQPGDTDTDGVRRNKRRLFQDNVDSSEASSDAEEYEDEDDDEDEEDEVDEVDLPAVKEVAAVAKKDAKIQLDKISKHLDVERSDSSSSSDDDFEIIDERELEELKNV